MSCSPLGLLFPRVDHLAKVSTESLTGQNQCADAKITWGFDHDVSSWVELRPAFVLAQHQSQNLYTTIEQTQFLSV